MTKKLTLLITICISLICIFSSNHEELSDREKLIRDNIEALSQNEFPGQLGSDTPCFLIYIEATSITQYAIPAYKCVPCGRLMFCTDLGPSNTCNF